MPFTSSMHLEIERAERGVGVASIPLSDPVSYNDRAFTGFAVGAVADVAAGAATLATVPADRMVLTVRIDASITGSTVGSRLSARAEIRDVSDAGFVYDAVVSVHRADDKVRVCGTATITLKLVG